MKAIRKITGIIISFFIAFAMLPWKVQALSAAPVFDKTVDVTTIHLHWTTDPSVSYYHCEYSVASQNIWSNVGNTGIYQNYGYGSGVSYAGTSFITSDDTEYDFRLCCSDSSGTQLSEYATISSIKRLFQNAESVETENGTNKYGTLREAIDKNSGTCSLKLLHSINESIDISSSNDVTLDLNGQIWTSTVGYAFCNYGKLTINDSTNCTGVITSDTSSTVAWNYNTYNSTGGIITKAELKLNNGIIRIAHDVNNNNQSGNESVIRNCGNFTINGGKVDGGMVLTGEMYPFNGYTGSSSLSLTLPLGYEYLYVNNLPDFSSTTSFTFWPHGVLKYNSQSVSPTVIDKSGNYTVVSPNSNQSNDTIIKAASDALTNTYGIADESIINNNTKDSIKNVAGNQGALVYPTVEIDGASGDGNIITSITYQISMKYDTLDNNEVVTPDQDCGELNSLLISLKIALPDAFEGNVGDSIVVRHTCEDNSIKEYTGTIVLIDEKKFGIFENPDGFSKFEIVKGPDTPVVSNQTASVATPDKSNESFLITYLDCKGNTVSVQWVKYGGTATAPAGFNYPTVANVSAHQDVKPLSCTANSKYLVPNTADKS